MKKLFAVILACLLSVPALAAEPGIEVNVPHAILMEKETGTVIWEKDADTPAAPASVTKVMTMLLIVEALDRGEINLDDTVTASARASSMGGSQVYLKEGECMSLRDMLKAIVVASGNDAAVAVAEHMCTTEEAFVERMNSRAAELGMKNTHFTNCTGLFDDEEHYISARDVAIMSRELIKHEVIKDYTTIWTDSLRDGEFGLANTNKLLRRYEGCTGLKTGFTTLAGYCLAATAQRGGTEYIAVVMGGATSEERFSAAEQLLDYAFAHFALAELWPAEAIPPVRVPVGEPGSLQPVVDGQQFLLLPRDKADKLEYTIELPSEVQPPVKAGQQLGKIHVSLEGEKAAELSLVAPADVPRRSPLDIFAELFSCIYG